MKACRYSHAVLSWCKRKSYLEQGCAGTAPVSSAAHISGLLNSRHHVEVTCSNIHVSATLPAVGMNKLRVTKSRRMSWAGHVARKGDRRGVFRVFVGKPVGKRPLGRPRRRWENNV